MTVICDEVVLDLQPNEPHDWTGMQMSVWWQPHPDDQQHSIEGDEEGDRAYRAAPACYRHAQRMKDMLQKAGFLQVHSVLGLHSPDEAILRGQPEDFEAAYKRAVEDMEP